jgi:hypothetical protein
MILTHFIAFDFWPGAAESDYVQPVVVPETGGGGGKKRKPFKSWDQRERERLEAIRADQEAKNKAKYGDIPKALEEALKPAPSPYKRLSPNTVKAYESARARDDEEAMALIMRLL